MRPPVTTTVQQNDHVAAAAYLMKRADASALVVVDTQTDQPIGIITEADITRAVADGKDLNEARIRQLMTTGPAVIDPDTSIRDAARTMTSGRFRHLPVVGETGVIGMLDITDVCRALLDLDVSQLA
jgi:CBS domain-containing protein